MKYLKKVIKKKYGFLYKYAKVLGISRVALSYKLNGQYPFTNEEIVNMAVEFDLTDKQIVDIIMGDRKRK